VEGGIPEAAWPSARLSDGAYDDRGPVVQALVDEVPRAHVLGLLCNQTTYGIGIAARMPDRALATGKTAHPKTRRFFPASPTGPGAERVVSHFAGAQHDRVMAVGSKSSLPSWVVQNFGEGASGEVADRRPCLSGPEEGLGVKTISGLRSAPLTWCAQEMEVLR